MRLIRRLIRAVWLIRRLIRWLVRLVFVVTGATALGVTVALLNLRLDRVYMPAEQDILNPRRLPRTAEYDLMGRTVAKDEATPLLRTEAGRRLLSPQGGAVRLTDGLEAEGREVFYRETWGNEAVLTDVLGILDGGLSALDFARAILALGGLGTRNLEVALSSDVTVGERKFRAGEIIRTGLAVPRGEFVPLGIRLVYDRGRVKVGATCALCHAAYDPASGKVIEGAPNTELNLGLLLALSSNPATFLGAGGIKDLERYQTRPENMVRLSNRVTAVLPDPEALARDLRSGFAAWPPGTFDSTTDRVSNPTSIPPVWTAESYPYGWSGEATLGPFRGLWSMTANLHGIDADPTALADDQPVFGELDPEFYLGIVLQRAARAILRFDPADGRKPSDILGDYDLDRTDPGIARVVPLPSYPRATYLSPTSLLPVRPGEGAMRPSLALAAFLNRLQPPAADPPARLPAGMAPDKQVALGREVFETAGCRSCHDGPALTSHRVWPAGAIGSEPSRARAYAWLDGRIDPPRLYPADTPLPLPENPPTVEAPVPDEGQLKLAWAHNRGEGGYRVPGLIGLRQTAPYLHDGGVAVGPDPARLAGVAALAAAGLRADPENSLRALVDRTLREKVLAANRASPALRSARVTGEGHGYWVDAVAGFSAADQDALVAYLLSFDWLEDVAEAGPGRTLPSPIEVPPPEPAAPASVPPRPATAPPRPVLPPSRPAVAPTRPTPPPPPERPTARQVPGAPPVIRRPSPRPPPRPAQDQPGER